MDNMFFSGVPFSVLLLKKKKTKKHESRVSGSVYKVVNKADKAWPL